MGEGVDPSPPLSRIRRRRLLLLLMQWRPRLLAEWRARQLGPCWFSISHWTTASLGALCPLPLRPSDAASGGTEPLSTLNPLLFVGLGTTTGGNQGTYAHTRPDAAPRQWQGLRGHS